MRKLQSTLSAPNLLCLCGFCFLLFACQAEDTRDSEDQHAKTMELFVENPQALAGKQIELRGYLDPRLGSLALYRDRQSAAKAQFEAKPIVIRDTSPNRNLRQEAIYVERTCTGSYVKLLGVVGLLEEHQFFGVSQIIEIRTFSDGNFLGEGKLCYSSDDPTIYSPQEI